MIILTNCKESAVCPHFFWVTFFRGHKQNSTAARTNIYLWLFRMQNILWWFRFCASSWCVQFIHNTNELVPFRPRIFGVYAKTTKKLINCLWPSSCLFLHMVWCPTMYIFKCCAMDLCVCALANHWFFYTIAESNPHTHTHKIVCASSPRIPLRIRYPINHREKRCILACVEWRETDEEQCMAWEIPASICARAQFMLHVCMQCHHKLCTISPPKPPPHSISIPLKDRRRATHVAVIEFIYE